MLPQTWHKVWHPRAIGVWDCPQYRCPSQGRMGRESSFLIPGLKKKSPVYSKSMVRNIVGRSGIDPLLSFSSSVRLKQNWCLIHWFSVPHSQRDGAEEKRPSAQIPVDFPDLSAVAPNLCVPFLLLIFTAAAPGHGYDAQADGGNGGACRKLRLCCDICDIAAWLSFSPRTQFERGNNIVESNVC